MTTRRSFKAQRNPLIATLISGLLFVTTFAQADHHAPALDLNVCAPDGVALGGYDAVSYASPDGPVAGDDEHAASHNGLAYHFVSQGNRDAFLAEPERYLPSYHGWCSTNLAMGRLACPDFANFKIEEGRVLLFERVGFTNGRDVWDGDPLTLRKQADANFLRFSGE